MYNDLLRFLLHSDAGSTLNNAALLAFRVLLAVELFRVHGMKKFRATGGAPEHVPNPLHLPERLNGFVATFSDTVVPVFVILGLCTRLAVLPTIGVTAVGYFIVHRHNPAEVRDVPFMYTLCFLFVSVVGGGSYSLDTLLLNYLLN